VRSVLFSDVVYHTDREILVVIIQEERIRVVVRRLRLEGWRFQNSTELVQIENEGSYWFAQTRPGKARLRMVLLSEINLLPYPGFTYYTTTAP
jgi:hypothetical protein